MLHWLRRVFHRSRAETDIDRELRFHLEQLISDNLAAGMTPEEARRDASIKLGGIERVKEEVRDNRWEIHLEQFFARRRLRDPQSAQRPPLRPHSHIRFGAWHRRVHRDFFRRRRRPSSPASLSRSFTPRVGR